LSEVDPYLNVELAEVTHVRTILFMNDQTDGTSRAKISGATLHVGNSTTVTSNPSCGVTVEAGGYYECDLWGVYVGITLTTSGGDIGVCELAVHNAKNVVPLGIISQSSTFGGRIAENCMGPEMYSNKICVTGVGDGTSWLNVDLGLPDLPIKTVIVHGRTRDGYTLLNYELRVGGEIDTSQNPLCTGTGLPDVRLGVEVQCNLPGQFVTLW